MITLYILHECDSWRSYSSMCEIYDTTNEESLEAFIRQYLEENSEIFDDGCASGLENVQRWFSLDESLIELVRNQNIPYLHLNVRKVC